MRKIIVFIILLLFTFTGCDPYAGKRPEDYPNTRWICEEPYVRIDVLKKSGVNNVGYIDYNGEITKIVLLFLSGPGVEIYRYEDYKTAINSEGMVLYDKMIIYGKCRFFEKKFIIEVEETTIFDESVEKLEFYRE